MDLDLLTRPPGYDHNLTWKEARAIAAIPAAVFETAALSVIALEHYTLSNATAAICEDYKIESYEVRYAIWRRVFKKVSDLCDEQRKKNNPSCPPP